MSKKTIRIGTRGSALALWQAEHVRDELMGYAASAALDIAVDIEVIHTKGDKILDVALSKIGDKGLFTKELERALLAGEVDCCVHSMKDMPTQFPNGLEISCMLTREDPRDGFVHPLGIHFEDLPMGARVGSSSLRRRAQLLALRPDLDLADIRGNVQTRLSRTESGEFDATLLAVAGMKRMEMDAHITEIFEPDVLCPAVGQGAIGVEIRSADDEMRELLAHINDEMTFADVSAERTILCELEGGCQVPLGAHVWRKGAWMSTRDFSSESDELIAFVASLDGSRLIRASRPIDDSSDLQVCAHEVLADLRAQGAEEILEEIR